MIVLDTNVISEAIKPEPNMAVQAWLDEQVAETLYLSSVTVAELLFGIGALPQGRRKDGLAKAIDGVLEIFEGRILPFDTAAARHHASLAVLARAAGKRSEEHTSELQSLMRNTYAVFCLKKKNTNRNMQHTT